MSIKQQLLSNKFDMQDVLEKLVFLINEYKKKNAKTFRITLHHVTTCNTQREEMEYRIKIVGKIIFSYPCLYFMLSMLL